MRASAPVRGPRRRRLRTVVTFVAFVLVAVVIVYGASLLLVDRSAIARAIAWQGADADDWKRFAARGVSPADVPLPLTLPADGRAALLARLRAPAPDAAPLERFLTATQTTAFLVLRDDEALVEWYGAGADRTSVATSFSVAKSFLSALVGRAIDQGHLAAVSDPMTRYVPELLERDPRFAQVTLHHLLSMSSGLRYEEAALPWSDDSLTYYDPDLRRLALTGTRVDRPAGEAFLYNNYNPLLLGLVLERAVGRPVAVQLEDLWQAAGMEFESSWSLDSNASGFEKLESGINARALDFARFGLLYLNDGRSGATQVLSADWTRASTNPASGAGAPDRGYGYFWWLRGTADAPRAMARGNKGQFIYVVPDRRLVMVRLGREFGYPEWPSLFDDLSEQVAALAPR